MERVCDAAAVLSEGGGEAHPDEDEFLDVERVPLDKALNMVMNNEINDAKTVFGILKYINLCKNNA